MSLKLLSFDGAKNQYKKTSLSWDQVNSKLGYTDFCEEVFITDTLTKSITNQVFTPFTFDKTIYSGIVVEYSIRENTSQKTRVGKLFICADGISAPSITDLYTETAGVDVKWSVAINEDDVEVKYTTLNGYDKVIKATSKKFLV
jgi:hypothetical protein